MCSLLLLLFCILYVRIEILPVSPAGAIACSEIVADLRADLANVLRPSLANNLVDWILGINGFELIGVFSRLTKFDETVLRHTLASIIFAC